MLDWLTSTGLRIVAILLSAYLVNKLLLSIVQKIIERTLLSDKEEKRKDQKKRINTVMKAFTSAVMIAVWSVALLLVLVELGVNLAPLLAGAGIIGFAVAFGAQEIMADFLSGFFIIAENQFRVGDIVEINGTGGKVKKITMRVTVLRDLDGNVHYIRNGEINMSTNKTMTFSKVNMDIGISYSSNIDKVERVVNQVGQDLADDEKWHEIILEAPKFLRINNFDDSAITIKITGKTKPGKHWKVAGELRRRLKKAFDHEGIEIPFPQTVIHQGKKNAN